MKKMIFTILLCLMVVTASGWPENPLPIEERIEIGTLMDMNDTEIQQIVEEEIENSIVKIDVIVIPIVKIETLELAILKILNVSIEQLTIQMITPDVIETLLVNLESAEIEKLAILIYDLSAQAKNLREEIDTSIGSAKLKKYLKNKNWAMCSNVLQEAGVDKEVVDTLISSIGKIPAPVVMPFFECKMAHTQTYKGEDDENAFIVGTYQEEVRQGDVVIFDVTSYSNLVRSIKFVELNKDKIGAIIVGWDSGGMNNYDNFNISTYPEVMEWYSDFYSVCKGIKSDLPIGVVVSMTITWKEWIDACTFKWDFIALWNITKFTANFKKIKDTYFRNVPVMIVGMNAGQSQKCDGDAYRNYIEELKELGYCGSIYIKTKGGE